MSNTVRILIYVVAGIAAVIATVLMVRASESVQRYRTAPTQACTCGWTTTNGNPTTTGTVSAGSITTAGGISAAGPMTAGSISTAGMIAATGQ